MTTLLEKIKSRGFWRIVIRPGRLEEKRIKQINELYPMIQKTSVELRGWDFPHLDIHTKPHIDIDWVGQESEWQEYLEIWRIYQSGQFIDLSGMPEDWRDQSTLWPPDENWKLGSMLGIGNALFTFTEVFEFAARLALTEAGDEIMHIEVTVSGLKGRRLIGDHPSRLHVRRLYEASLQEFPFATELPRGQLIAQPRSLALKAATELFARFNWKPSEQLLQELQKELWK